MLIFSLILIVLITPPLIYWILMAFAAVRKIPVLNLSGYLPKHTFIIVIPAHDEENVIERTVKGIQKLDYPERLYKIHIVADHCSDGTAASAREAGAIVHERNSGPRTGKGAALSWFFERVLSQDSSDAVVVFDADTSVDPEFLKIMDARLSQGHPVIQGRHIISNPRQGWFPALTWAMFMIDNRFQNRGRNNLGWSAKHMGDSICFRKEVLQSVGWGRGLTEDYQLRQKLLLKGIQIFYEPRAKGFGEAPLSWKQAKDQRARWLRGTQESSSQFGKTLLLEGLKKRDGALLDGAFQAYFPSYSTLSLISCFVLIFHIFIDILYFWEVPNLLIGIWAFYTVILFVYPFWGLALNQAPFLSYLVILSGPFFILWRTWLALKARFGRKPVLWKRTLHGN